MGRKSEKTRFPNRWHVLSFRVKGNIKNLIVDYAREKNITVNELITFSVYEFVRLQKGIPSPGSAQYSLPTAQEEIAAYLRGEKLLEPCGQKNCTKKITEIDSMKFCETCNLRID
jgi:hypothetical protein